MRNLVISSLSLSLLALTLPLPSAQAAPVLYRSLECRVTTDTGEALGRGRVALASFNKPFRLASGQGLPFMDRSSNRLVFDVPYRLTFADGATREFRFRGDLTFVSGGDPMNDKILGVLKFFNPFTGREEEIDNRSFSGSQLNFRGNGYWFENLNGRFPQPGAAKAIQRFSMFCQIATTNVLN